jgi:hypothetical protein
LIGVNVLKDGSDLIKSAVICLLAPHLVFRYDTCTRLKVLLVLNQAEIRLVHLSAHVLEVLENANLVLFIFPIKEGLVRVLVVL